MPQLVWTIAYFNEQTEICNNLLQAKGMTAVTATQKSEH